MSRIALLLGALLVAAICWGFAERSDATSHRAEVSALAAKLTIAQAAYAEASTQRKTDSVEVIRWETRTRTLRDTLSLTDTVAIKEYIVQTDTLRAVCLRCLASSAALQRASDSPSTALSAERDYWRQSAIRSSKTAKMWPYALGAGVLLGAWVRGSGR